MSQFKSDEWMDLPYNFTFSCTPISSFRSLDFLAYIIFTRQDKRESREGSCHAISLEEEKHCEDEVSSGLV